MSTVFSGVPVATVAMVAVALTATFAFTLLMLRHTGADRDVSVRVSFTPWPRVDVRVRPGGHDPGGPGSAYTGSAGNGSATTGCAGPECGIVRDMPDRRGSR